jgi:hypothetical protein
MTYKFGLQKHKDFGKHAEICKSLRGVGLIIARMFGGTYEPLGHHCYMAVINEESHYLTAKDILLSSKEDVDYFRREGKEIIHVCTNCGQVQEDLKK